MTAEDPSAKGEMKIVTYNVNGLKQRILQYGSLLKLLSSFDADIICFQETKLSREELTADLVMADGYESFFSCTRTFDRGRRGYSGVATFCRVKSAFTSNEVALPLAAKEGITGFLENCRESGIRKDELPAKLEGLEGIGKDELLKVDAEGRCIITDHGHFVLFNVYGPRADSDDTERIQFKLTFFNILQKRWEALLSQERRIFVVGDLNIAPSAIDRCDAGPDFEKNEFRSWFRSMLVECGGRFYDVFRVKHPNREAYTCWPQHNGAELFNYGSRIDHILCAGSCLHEQNNQNTHDFVTCHVEECDIMTQFKRWKPGYKPRHRWKGGESMKLEGSDHAPVFVSLREIPDVSQHNTPSLSARYDPRVRGCQQTIVSALMKRQVADHVKTEGDTSSFVAEKVSFSSNAESEPRPTVDGHLSCLNDKTRDRIELMPGSKSNLGILTKKRPRENQWSQLSLTTFFQKSSNYGETVSIAMERDYCEQSELSSSDQSKTHGDSNNCDSSFKEKNSVALMEWQRIQQLMQDSIPLCKGHREPCVARVSKKAGPNLGRRFYVCARGEGPSSNPEANCGYFKWASSKSKNKQ